MARVTTLLASTLSTPCDALSGPIVVVGRRTRSHGACMEEELPKKLPELPELKLPDLLGTLRNPLAAADAEKEAVKARARAAAAKAKKREQSRAEQATAAEAEAIAREEAAALVSKTIAKASATAGKAVLKSIFGESKN